MKLENELAIVVAFYLSKFGDEGLAKLGFQSYRHAFFEIGHSLHVNPNSVKNWRDEFDPYYDNGRKGWYQRGIRPSRQKVMAAFDNLSESALREVVLNIIQPKTRAKVETELQTVLYEVKAEGKKTAKRNMIYVPRGPTGRMAEEFFVSRFNAGMTPFEGTLKDKRDDGVGFDFEIASENKRTFVEVKGLAKELGAITFTDKEWKVANETQNDYFLGVVVQITESPKIGFVQNPALNFTPNYYAYATVTINWAINAEQIATIAFA